MTPVGRADEWTPLRALCMMIVVGLAYAAGSQMSYEWFAADGTSASFFPAAGVTMAALFTLDRRWWPSVLVGVGSAEVLIDLTHHLTLTQSLGYAGANLVQPVVAAVVLRRSAGRLDLARVGHLTAFLLGAVVIGPLVGGIAGASVHVATVHVATGGEEWARFVVEWWIGDGLGVLVVGGILLGLRATTPRGAVAAGTLERLIYLGMAVVGAFIAFRFDVFALVYLPFGLLFVIAVRAGTRDVAVVGALVAFVAAEGTARGHRFWDGTDVTDSSGLMYLQLALVVVIAGALVMAAALAERDVSTMARTDALSAQRAATVARERAELLGRLGEAFGRATRPPDVRDALAAFGLEQAWTVEGRGWCRTGCDDSRTRRRGARFGSPDGGRRPRPRAPRRGRARQVLLSLSDQSGLALDRADLQTSAERAAADAALLARLSDALDRSTTAKERARHVVGELMVRGAGSVAIELADEDGHTVLAVGGPTHELSSPERVVPLQARGRVLGRISIGSGDLGPTGRSGAGDRIEGSHRDRQRAAVRA